LYRKNVAALASQPPLKTWTRDELEALEAAGLLAGTRFELIDGQLFDRMGQNPPHAYVVTILTGILIDMFGRGRLRVQLPVEPAEAEASRSLPQPDFAVTRESAKAFATRHPGAEDVVLIIEVTDTTFEYDTKLKARLYARAGFQEYVVVDLNSRQLRVHQSPRGDLYSSIRIFQENETYLPSAASAQSIRVSELLPPAGSLD
jgi:Uma2 family endonuclease